MKLHYALLALLFSTPAMADCDGILALTRESSSDAKFLQMADQLQQSQCSGTQLKSNWNVSVGVEAVIDAVPFKGTFGGGSSKDKMERFCSQYGTWKKDNSVYIVTNTKVPDTAILQWGNCKKLEQRGIEYSVQASQDRLTISVKRGIDDAEFQGASYTSSLMTCSGAFGANQSEVTINTDTRFQLLRSNEYPFTCARELSSDGSHYPTATIAVRTQGGDALLVTLPREDVSGGIFLGPLEQKVSELSEQVAKIEARRLICTNRTVESAVGGSNPNVHWIEMTARIPDDVGPEYIVTGGGCQIRKAPGDPHWSYIGNGNITSDQRGWFCSTEHVPGRLSKRSLISTVIYCKSGP